MKWGGWVQGRHWEGLGDWEHTHTAHSSHTHNTQLTCTHTHTHSSQTHTPHMHTHTTHSTHIHSTYTQHTCTQHTHTHMHTVHTHTAHMDITEEQCTLLTLVVTVSDNRVDTGVVTTCQNGHTAGGVQCSVEVYRHKAHPHTTHRAGGGSGG